MLDSALALWALALVLGWVAHKRGLLQVASQQAAIQFIALMPRIAVALVLAGFVGKLMPSEAIAGYIGPDSGFKGIAIAAILGGFVPSGPIVSFPIVVVLRHAGAGWPQVTAFLTAWSVIAFHRVIVYETALMGWRFVLTRWASSLMLPPIAGVLTLIMCNAFNVH